jgi:hypothetical protein
MDTLGRKLKGSSQHTGDSRARERGGRGGNGARTCPCMCASNGSGRPSSYTVSRTRATRPRERERARGERERARARERERDCPRSLFAAGVAVARACSLRVQGERRLPVPATPALSVGARVRSAGEPSDTILSLKKKIQAINNVQVRFVQLALRLRKLLRVPQRPDGPWPDSVSALLRARTVPQVDEQRLIWIEEKTVYEETKVRAPSSVSFMFLLAPALLSFLARALSLLSLVSPRERSPGQRAQARALLRPIDVFVDSCHKVFRSQRPSLFTLRSDYSKYDRMCASSSLRPPLISPALPLQTLKECKLEDGGTIALIYKKPTDVSSAPTQAPCLSAPVYST